VQTGNVKGVIELAGADVLRDVTRGKELCFQISYPRHPHKRRCPPPTNPSSE
jgi:hypothetical protein